MAILRTALALAAIAVAFSGCKKPQEQTESRTNRPLAEFIKDQPPGGTPTKVAYASIDLSCGSKTYTIKTGTDGGRCEVTTYPDKPKDNHAVCSDGDKGGGGANCTEGCVSSEGAGSCSVKSR